MRVERLWLTDFRNYQAAELELADGLTVVVDGRAVLVAISDGRPYDLVRDAVADLGLPLVRIEQRRHRLEDLFRDLPGEAALPAEAAAASAPGSPGSSGSAPTAPGGPS